MGEHHISLRRSPSLTSCCQLQDPCPEGPTVEWALGAPLSHLDEFCGVSPGFAEVPLQWLVLEWVPGRARGCMGQGEHGSFSLQRHLCPKASKMLISTQAEDLNSSCCSGKLYIPLKRETNQCSTPFVKVRNAGDDADTLRCNPVFPCLGALKELCGSRTESFPLGKTHDRLYILGICDPFSWHCPKVCCWEAILHSEIPYLEE